MRMSLELFSGFADSKVQRLIEREQTAITCGLLALITKAFARNELNILTMELSNFAATNEWPKFAPSCLINLVTLHHLQQRLALLAKNVNFGSLELVLNSLPNNVLQEIVEGFLSAFQERLDTFSLTNEDVTQAFEKYGVPSAEGNSRKIGDADMFRDTIARIRMHMPRYDNCITKQSELEEAKRKVATYKIAQNQEKQVNYQLSTCLMGYVKQAWAKGHWDATKSETAFQRLITYQENNFSQYSQRPIGELAIRVRDYVSLQSKSPTISAHSSEQMFQDIWKLFRRDLASFIETQGLLEERGMLKHDVDDQTLDEAFCHYRLQIPPAVIEELSAKFATIRDALRQWEVMVGLPNVKAEQGGELPALDHVTFLNPQEAEAWYNAKKDSQSWDLDFSSVKGYALVSQIEARDSTRAAQIAYRRVRAVLDQFLFHHRHGRYNNPQPNGRNMLCVETNAAGEHKIWLAHAISNKVETELLIRHPNIVTEQTKMIEELSRLVGKANSNHPLSKRIIQAIYWYRKAMWTELAEDCLLYYWVSLETLVGLEEEAKNAIPYRTSLLVPAKVPVDGQLTYRQLRNWTREFLEDVYHLRNEIVHGGVFEGPSFERFVDRFRSTVHGAIMTVFFTFISELPTPDNLDEILAWIWDRNPDSNVALPNPGRG